MIGRLRGTLAEKAPPFILLDVAGVGYEVQLPMNCFYRLPDIGESVSIVTHFVVREDAQLLYGFHDQETRSMFRELIKVNGIGPKVALAILSGLNSQQLVAAVSSDDLASLTKVPGVGKKTAERLLVELKDRLKNWDIVSFSSQGNDVVSEQDILNNGRTPVYEACEALVVLGYKPAVAERVVKQLHQKGQTCESLIREALKSMV